MRLVAVTLLTLGTASWLMAQQNATPAAATVAPVATSQANPRSSSPQNSPSQPPAPANTANSGAGATPAAQSPESTPPPAPGLQPNSLILPTVTKREMAEAKKQFQAGVKLKSKGQLDEAFDKFSSASELDPRNVTYITAREFTREQLAMEALKRGNKAMLEKNEIVAMAEFRRALDYDPTNTYALQRLHDAMPQTNRDTEPVSIVEQSMPLQVQPVVKHQDFHFRGDSRTLLTEVARAYGLSAQFDDSVQSRRVHFDIQDVNFATAVEAANAVTKSFWVPLSARQIYFLADTIENHRNFDRMGLKTFYLPELTDQELAEWTNSLRVLLNLRFITPDKAQSTLTIRAEWPVLQAAEHLIRSLTTGRPEVMLDMRVYAISTSLARSLGVAMPTQFTMFNISPALLAGLGASATNLINQLIASGGINQANSTAISALLAQLQNSSTSSILTQPFVTFGGGLTLFGISAAGVGMTPTFSLNTSDIRDLEHVQLRASHNDPATLKIGERYPIINATFAPIYNSSSIASVIGNQSYTAPFPSFNFEDLGLILKATPWIHANSDVTLKMDLTLRSLGTTNVNGIPIINNRQYTGTITMMNGESSVITGLIDMSDTRDISGYPFLGQIPGLGYGASLHNKNVTEDELLVVITPHVVRLPQQASFAVELPPAH